MNYDFFASRSDKVRLLEFLLGETDLRIFDSYSEYEKKAREYKSVGDITGRFDLENGGKFAVTLALWSPRFSERLFFKQIKLDPRRCQGSDFRYATSGLGLIHLHFGGIEKRFLNVSHIGHQSEKRAKAWESTIQYGDRASRWNWNEIASSARKLKSTIHNKWAVDKIGSVGVLPGAKEMQIQGFQMGHFNEN